VAHSPDNALDAGYVRGHTPRMYLSRRLTAYKINRLLYVDNGAFPFPTRAALINGLTLVHSHLARFGLEVHIGRNDDPSKTECLFFPPLQFFNDIQSSAPTLTDDVDQPWLIYQDSSLVPETPHNTATMLCHSKTKKMNEKKKETRESARQKRKDAKYDALPETEQFDIADGYVTFC
jgi:hypothetical protein